MGMFCCEMCNEGFGITGPDVSNHVCKPEDIRGYVATLRAQENQSRIALDNARNAVFMTLQSLPSLELESVTVETRWLRKLWEDAGCGWYEMSQTFTSADNFLSRWMVLHRILCEAFDLFRSRKGETTLEKLRSLRRACDEAREALGYQNSHLDLRPEDIKQ